MRGRDRGGVWGGGKDGAGVRFVPDTGHLQFRPSICSFHFPSLEREGLKGEGLLLALISVYPPPFLWEFLKRLEFSPTGLLSVENTPSGLPATLRKGSLTGLYLKLPASGLASSEKLFNSGDEEQSNCPQLSREIKLV